MYSHFSRFSSKCGNPEEPNSLFSLCRGHPEVIVSVRFLRSVCYAKYAFDDVKWTKNFDVNTPLNVASIFTMFFIK